MHRPIAARDFARLFKEMMTYISFHHVVVLYIFQNEKAFPLAL